MNIIIGVDPDAVKNGIAIFIDSKLCELKSMTTLEFYFYLENLINDKKIKNIQVAIEDVKRKKPTFEKYNRRGSKSVSNKISQDVGKCKQAQTEIERCCEQLKIEYLLFCPSSSFKKGAQINIFKQLTGYNKRSNEDQRSAAFFGYQALKGKVKK